MTSGQSAHSAPPQSENTSAIDTFMQRAGRFVQYLHRNETRTWRCVVCERVTSSSKSSSAIQILPLTTLAVRSCHVHTYLEIKPCSRTQTWRETPLHNALLHTHVTRVETPFRSRAQSRHTSYHGAATPNIKLKTDHCGALNRSNPDIEMIILRISSTTQCFTSRNHSPSVPTTISLELP